MEGLHRIFCFKPSYDHMHFNYCVCMYVNIYVWLTLCKELIGIKINILTKTIGPNNVMV